MKLAKFLAVLLTWHSKFINFTLLFTSAFTSITSNSVDVLPMSIIAARLIPTVVGENIV